MTSSIEFLFACLLSFAVLHFALAAPAIQESEKSPSEDVEYHHAGPNNEVEEVS